MQLISPLTLTTLNSNSSFKTGALTLKLFAAFFSFFCLYFLHTSEAKAAAMHADSGYVQDGGSPAISKYSHGKVELNKWLQWPGILSAPFELFVSEKLCTTVSKVFTAIGAKKFSLKTGLSPPLLFV
jgi:hypothetical protein